MLAGLENARDTTLQADFHLTAQDKNPLLVRRTMKLAAKTHGTVT